MSSFAAPGRILAGKYRLLERVGTGGMSDVYRAEELGGGRVVAVKVLLPHRLEDPTIAQRLFQEAQSVFRIRHPGIVHVHEAGQSDFGPFLVMDYLLGESAARRLLSHGRFSVEEAVATMLPVLHSLEAAHDAGVVHRDLKPGNIFFAVEGSRDVSVRLLDFGVAKLLRHGANTPRTSTGVVMGTPDYLSPEQANGEASLDGRSDLFAAGVVLFELLTATRPFHAPSAVATAYKVAHLRTPSLKERGGPADSTLQAIVERALAKRPEERYPTARELATELEGLLHGTSPLEILRALVQPERFRPGSGTRPVSQQSQPPPLPSWAPAAPTLGAGSREEKAAAPRHVRGIAIRAIDRYASQVFGNEARERALAALPKDVADELVYDSLQAIVNYDVDVLNLYCETLTRSAALGNAGWARSGGARAVETDLGALLRTTTRPLEAHALLPRVTSVLARLFSFGSWDIEDNGSVTTLRIGDMGALGATARLWLVGVIEGAFGASGTRARVTIARGEVAHAPMLILDVTG